MKKLLVVLLFVPLVSFGQMDYYVSAKGGLNVREAPEAKAKKVATLLYGQKVTIESKTDIKLTINDTDKETGITKVVEGEWVEITSGEKIRGYVFDGFLKGVKSGTDFYTLTIEGNSKIYDYDSYQIITTALNYFPGYPPELNGEQIKIYSKDDESIEFTIGDNNNEVFFGGIVQGFMIIYDGGMSSPEDNGFRVFDLQNQKYVFRGSYSYSFKIVNSKIEFYDVAQNPYDSYQKGTQAYEDANKKFDKVKCSEEMEKLGKEYPGSIGYIEKFIYDIATQQLERTGLYECAYFQ